MPEHLHRVAIPRGARLAVGVGDQVVPHQLLATQRAPGRPLAIEITGPLHRSPREIADLLLRAPGATVQLDEVIARTDEGREVRAPAAGLLVAYSRTDGTAVLAPLGAMRPLLSSLRGRVEQIDAAGIVLRVPAVVIHGVAASGDAVHGELRVSVHEPGEELRAGAIDVGATGRILVGGSRASAETLTRARAMGVAGIVLGGMLDKELRDFEAIQQRRREIGGISGAFGVLLVEGFGKVGLDPELFAWLRAHGGHEASLVGEERALYVYEAESAPARRPLPRIGDAVVAHRRPFQGRGGTLVAILDDLHAAPSGLIARMALVRFGDGRLAPVPLANLEAIGAMAERVDGS
jgi:hypothetical protein